VARYGLTTNVSQVDNRQQGMGELDLRIGINAKATRTKMVNPGQIVLTEWLMRSGIPVDAPFDAAHMLLRLDEVCDQGRIRHPAIEELLPEMLRYRCMELRHYLGIIGVQP